jgi:hypothetical protein
LVPEAGWAGRLPGAGTWRRLSAPGPLRRGEFLVALVLLTLFAAAVFAPHVRDGGFYNDDWWLAATYHLGPPPGYINAVEAVRDTVGARPLFALALPLPHALFGSDTGLHIALALALGVLISAGFFAVLRQLGLEPLPAIIIAGLALVFPWSDSTRLWSIGGLAQLGVCLYLAGAVVALGGMRLRGPRAAVVHALALTLYVASLLTYEAVAGLALTSGVLYLVRARGTWAAVRLRWLADVVVATIVLAWVAGATSGTRETPSAGSVLGDLRRFTGEALELVGHAVRADGPALVPALVGAAVLLVLLVRGLPSDPDVRRDLRRWSVVAGVATLELGAAFAPFVGSGLHPLDAGYGNRGNIVVALPISALVYAFVALAALIVVPRRRKADASPALVVTASVAIVIGLGYAHLVRNDIGRWNRAAALQERVLAGLEATVPDPRPGSVLYAYGFPALVSPGVLVFAQTWDLSSAVKLVWDDHTLRAYPIVEGTRFACAKSGLYPFASPVGDGYGRAQGAPYGKAIFVDAASRRARLVRSKNECRKVAESLRPGPVVGEALASPH